MIYTTYFAKLKKLPEDIVPISIALYSPKGVDIIKYPKLFPSTNTLSKWKSLDRNQFSEEDYVKEYIKYVLEKLDPLETAIELKYKAGNSNIALVCYEKSGEFCHRNIVSKWFIDNGIPCEEWK
jgi:predicted secreted protein